MKPRKQDLALQQYQRGDEISTLDSGIWQVYRGVVQLSRIQADGSEIVTGWVTANNVFGSIIETSVLYRAVALGDVYAKRYSVNLVRHPLLMSQFLSQFSDRLVKTQQLLAIIAIGRVDERLRQLLLMLKEEMGQPTDDGSVQLQVRFTHQHLAEAIRTTRVTITRILGDFQSQDLIYFDRDRHIVIKNL